MLKNSIILSFILFLPCVGRCENQSDLTIQSAIPNVGPENPPTQTITKKKRVIETGNDVVIDGSVRVLEQLFIKSFTLVEISTPVTPSANHARIWLRPDGSKSTLVVTFDDGTTVDIVGN